MAGKSSQSTLVTTSLMLPLGQLRPGHEAEPPVNIRTPVDGPELAALAANIADRIAGRRPPLIEPLLVVAGPKPRGKNATQIFYVCDGGRRLAALTRLLDQGIVTDELQLPVVEHARVEGLEVSTTAAVLAAPHHPVDQYEAFAGLIAARGDRPEADTVAWLARRFAITPLRVRQIQALGALAPEVRQAWRSGLIDRTTAQAFTLTNDLARQAETLAAIENREGHVSPHRVRQFLLAGRIHAESPAMSMVGLETYVAAGGTLTGDLFSADRYVADEKLFAKLQTARRKAIGKSILAEGWGFVFWADQPEAEDWWHWRRQQPGEPVWTEEAAAERDRLKAEIAALDATARAALESQQQDDDDGDFEEELAEDEALILSLGGAPDQEPEPVEGPTLRQQRDAANVALSALDAAARRAGYPAEERQGLACILNWNANGLSVSAGYVPPGIDKGDEAEGPEGDAGTDEQDDGNLGGEDLDDAPGSAPAPEPVGAELPRAARQSLSLVANRAAAATIAADTDLALSLLAAAWIARREVHASGNGVPLIVKSDGLRDGPAGDIVADLVAGPGGRPSRWQKSEREPYFAGLAAAILVMSRPRRLELVAALAAAALDLSSDTLENRNNHVGQKNVSPDGIAALRAFLPNAPFETNARLILAGAGEAEALFSDWGKAQLVEALRALDGDDAARQAAKAKKGDLVALVAERARATGWLPAELRGMAPVNEASPEGKGEGSLVASAGEPSDQKEAA